VRSRPMPAAHAMYDRLKQASEQKAGLVAQQEVDDAQAKDLEAEAGVSSAQAAFSMAQQALQVAQANQNQFSALSNYTRIVAPFAGVVTARYADTGALIAAGTSSSSQSVPVVRLAEVSTVALGPPGPGIDRRADSSRRSGEGTCAGAESGHRGQGVQVRWLSG